MRKSVWLQLFCHKMSQAVFSFAMFMQAPKVHNTYCAIVKQHCGSKCLRWPLQSCDDFGNLTNIPLAVHLCK